MDAKIAAGVTKLRLKYPGESALLFRDLSIRIGQGEKVLILGPSGSGKSTLLQVLSGLAPEAVPLPLKYDDRIVPERWAFVFQDPDTQFCMPFVDEELAFVLENMRMPRARMREAMSYYLRQVGLHWEELHRPIDELSQGTKQRLAIASALAMEPDVLFLDEPTALLDQEGTSQIWRTIRRAADHLTLVMVEHKLSGVLDLAERVVLLDAEGRIAADGAPERVFREHRPQLLADGIWYPGIWDDYLAAKPRKPPSLREPDEALRLSGFQACRQGKAVVRVEAAQAAAGEFIAVTGPNGAGKSTLLLAIMRLVKSEGTCRVNGLESTRVEQLAKHASIAFQNPELQFIEHSVAADMRHAIRSGGAAEERVEHRLERLLDAFGMRELRDRHPYQLSMGEKRRLSAALAVAGGQNVLLMDEPTFGLDARSVFDLLELLDDLREQGTVIVMATHDADIVRRYATQVWHIQDGTLRVVTPAEWEAAS